MADSERLACGKEGDPKVLIEKLRAINREQFACGLIMLVPTEASDHAAILLPVQREQKYGGEFSRAWFVHGAFTVHPERGFILIQGDAAEKLLDFSNAALQETSLTEPSEIIFSASLDELFQEHPGQIYTHRESQIINLAGPDDDRYGSSWRVSDTWSEAYIKALESARLHNEGVAQRGEQLSKVVELFT